MTSLRKKVIFSLIPLLVLLFLAETTCRIKYYLLHDMESGYLIAPFGKQTHYSDLKGIKVDRCPEQKEFFSPCQGEVIIKSYFELGERCWAGEPFSLEKPQGVYRILLVGGSSVECCLAGNEDTWGEQLEEQLNLSLADSCRYQVEVINGGRTARNAYDIKHLLMDTGFSLSPDLIVYYEAYNETNSAFITYRMGIIARSWSGWLHKMLYLNSMLYTYLVEKRQFSMLRNQYLISPELGNKPPVARFVESNFTPILESCRDRGVPVVYVRQVIDYPLTKAGLNLVYMEDLAAGLQRIDDSQERRGKQTGEEEFTISDVIPLRQRMINFFQSEICRRHQVSVIDPLPAFDKANSPGGPPLFTDLVHKTCYGNRLLAELISEALRDRIKLEIAAREGKTTTMK